MEFSKIKVLFQKIPSINSTIFLWNEDKYEFLDLRVLNNLYIPTHLAFIAALRRNWVTEMRGIACSQHNADQKWLQTLGPHPGYINSKVYALVTA